MRKYILIGSVAVFGFSCQTNNKYSKAVNTTDRLEVVTSDDMRSSFNLSKRENLIKNSLKTAEKSALKGDKTAGTYLTLAKLAILSADYPKAIKYSKAAIKKDLDNPNDARKVLFKAYVESGQMSLAKLVGSTLGGIESNDPNVLNGLGIIALQEGEVEHSLAIFEKAVKNNPSNLAARMNLGSIYTQISDFDRAEKNYKVVLKKWPNNVDAQIGLGTVYNKMIRYHDASYLFTQALRQESKNEIALYNGAYSFYKINHLNKAKSSLKKFMKISKNGVDVKRSQKLLVDVEKAIEAAEKQASKRSPQGEDTAVNGPR